MFEQCAGVDVQVHMHQRIKLHQILTEHILSGENLMDFDVHVQVASRTYALGQSHWDYRGRLNQFLPPISELESRAPTAAVSPVSESVTLRPNSSFSDGLGEKRRAS